MLCKVGNELIIGMKPGLGKAGNSFNYSRFVKVIYAPVFNTKIIDNKVREYGKQSALYCR